MKKIVFFLIVGFLLGYFGPKLTLQFKSSSAAKTAEQERSDIFAQINPEKGYLLNSSYGYLGPKMVTAGIIDLNKFKNVYAQANQALTQNELNILTNGSNKKIAINRQNSYFLLNFFWAVGLGNKTSILTNGDMTKYGQNQVGNFASTGGWSLAAGNPIDYYAKSNLVSLTPAQEAKVLAVSSNIYRPCCNNPTSFPDCNHGMALLGLLEVMAAQGSSENQMYEAAKYFNAFWFPTNYYDLAVYFKNKDGKSFAEVPGEVILGKDYSSATGWQNIKQWLTAKGIEPPPSSQGASCGV